MAPSVFGKEAEEVKETAVVVAVDSTTTKVQLNVNSACSSCGAAALCHPSAGMRPRIEITNEIDAKVGDIVELETAASSRLIAALLLFGLPLVLILLGAFIGGSMENAGQDSIVAGSIAGLALGLLLVNRINRWFQRRLRFKPRAIRIISP